MANLKVGLAMRKDEIRELKVRVESLEQIKEVVGTPGDVLNKARLFDNDIKTEGEVSASKIVQVLVTFIRKMEAALVDIRILVSGSLAKKTSRPYMPPPKDTSRKEKPLEEIKTPLPQCPGKKEVVETSQVVPPTEVLAATPSSVDGKKAGKDSASSEPSSQRQDSKKKKKKEPTLEEELEEESTAEDTGSSKEDAESKEEPSTPPPEPKAKIRIHSIDKKKPPPVYKSSVAPKRPTKTPQKGEGSNKKPRGK